MNTRSARLLRQSCDQLIDLLAEDHHHVCQLIDDDDDIRQWIEFRPSIKGLPTIYDKDLIIYAISQLIAGMKEGRAASKRVMIDPYAFLVFTQRGVGGRDYDALCDSLDRIDGTRFRTNILFDGTRTDEWMGIIDGAKMQTDERTGKIKSLELKLSDMVISEDVRPGPRSGRQERLENLVNAVIAKS